VGVVVVMVDEVAPMIFCVPVVSEYAGADSEELSTQLVNA
jgi:hypothetical protein